MKKTGIIKTFVFSIIPLIFLLLVVELALRVAGFNYAADYDPIVVKNKYGMGSYESIFEFSPDTIWKLKPNSVHVMKTVSVVDGKPAQAGTYDDRINSHGFRGPEISLGKPENTVRVACLGDSSTFGFNVRAQDSYPALLEKVLNEKLENKGVSRRVEVINGGIIGYTSTQALIHYEKSVAAFDPDFVIIMIGIINEVFRQEHTDYEQIEILRANRGVDALSNVLRRFRISQLITKMIQVGKSAKKKIRANGVMKRRVPVEQFRNDINKFVELSRRDNFKLIMVVPPRKQTLFDRFPELAGYDSAIIEAANENKLVALRIDRIFDTHPEKEYLFSARDDYHPTMAGYALIANILATHIEPAVENR